MNDSTREDGAAAPDPAAAPPPSTAVLRALLYYAVGLGGEAAVDGRDTSARLRFPTHPDDGLRLGAMQTDLGHHPEHAERLLAAYVAWAQIETPDSAPTAEDRARLAELLAQPGLRAPEAAAPTADAAADDDSADPVAAAAAGWEATADADSAGEGDAAGVAADAEASADTTTDAVGDDVATAEAADDQSAADAVAAPPTLNAADIEGLSGFLASLAGRAWLAALDDARIDALHDAALRPLCATDTFAALSAADRLGLCALLATVARQSEVWTERALDRIEAGQYRSVADLRAGLSLRPRPTDEDARGNALEATVLLLRLEDGDPLNPLRIAWRRVVAAGVPPEPLRPDADREAWMLACEHEAMRILFAMKRQASTLIAALDRLGTCAIGTTDPHDGGLRGGGLFSAGREFVIWDADGNGIALVGGRWRPMGRDLISLLRRADGTLDLFVQEGAQRTLLLRIPPRDGAASSAGGSARGAEEPLEGDLRDQRGPTVDPHALVIEKWSQEQQKVYENVREKAQELGLPKDRADMLAAHTVVNWRENEKTIPRVDYVHVSRAADGDTRVTLAYMQHGQKEPIFTQTTSLNNSPAFEQSAKRMEQLSHSPTANQQQDKAQEVARNEAHMQQMKDGQRTPGQDHLQQMIEGVANPILRNKM
jgi:hypothetical protein